MSQIIDYTEHPEFHRYLTAHHSSAPFDAIIDITGSDPLLYQQSPAYLTSEGCLAFAGNMSRTHSKPGSGPLGALLWILGLITLVLTWQLDSVRPVVLGGVPRRSFFFSEQPNARNLGLVRQLVEDGTLKGVVDSVWDMEKVIEVSSFRYQDPPCICV